MKRAPTAVLPHSCCLNCHHLCLYLCWYVHCFLLYCLVCYIGCKLYAQAGSARASCSRDQSPLARVGSVRTWFGWTLCTCPMAGTWCVLMTRCPPPEFLPRAPRHLQAWFLQRWVEQGDRGSCSRRVQRLSVLCDLCIYPVACSMCLMPRGMLSVAHSTWLIGAS